MDSARPPLHDALAALAQAVADFDQAACGDSGDKLKQLPASGATSGVIPQLCRTVLQVIYEALTALRKAMIEGEQFLLQADAALALFVVAEQALVAMEDAVGEAAAGLGNTFGAQPLHDARNVLLPLKTALAKANVLDGVLPLPQDLMLVRQALTKVLGEESGPAGGSLGQLQAAVAGSASATSTKDTEVTQQATHSAT